MKKIRVADYLSIRASQAGASYAFIVTGGGAMHLNDCLLYTSPSPRD